MNIRITQSIVFIFTFFSGFPSVFGEIHALQIRNSMYSNSISAFSQDDSGFIWIGTDNGLERYDGYTTSRAPFEQFHQMAPTRVVKCILQSTDGTTFVGSEDGFFRCEKNLNSIKQLFPFRVLAIAQDEKSNLWLASEQGLYIIDLNGNIIQHFTEKNGLLDSWVTSVVFDQQANVWVSTGKGITVFTPTPDGQFHIRTIEKGMPIDHLSIDNQRDVWYSSGEYIFSGAASDLLSGSKAAKYICGADVAAIFPLDTTIWVGTRGNGILVLKRNLNNHIELSKKILPDRDNINELKNSITTFFQDAYSNLWIGSRDGVFLLPGKQYSIFTHIIHDDLDTNTPVNNIISGMYCDQSNRIWMATSKGLDCFFWEDRLNGKYRIHHYPDNNRIQGDFIWNNKINTLIGINDHTLLISSKNYVKFFDTDKFFFYESKALSDTLAKYQMRFVRSFTKDNRGNILMGFDSRGIVIYNPAKQIIKPVILGDGDTWKILVDKEGTIWLAAGKNGLYKLRNDRSDYGGKWQQEKFSPENFNKNYLNTVFRDSQGILWLGTSNGVYRQDQTGAFEPIDMPVNNDNYYIAEITEDPYKNLWIYGLRGLYQMDKDRNIQTIRYYESDNVDFARIFYVFGQCINNEGWLFFGGVNGLHFFDPTQLLNSEMDIPPVFSSLTINDKAISPFNKRFPEDINTIDKILLHHTDYLVSFDVSTLYYPNPSKVQYAYKLEGRDNNWITLPSKTRTITFSNLPAGNYRLHVKAINRTGAWSESIKTLTIAVGPPWWNSWWSWILYFSLFSGIAYLAFRVYFANYRIRHQEEINQWKFRYYTNFSHSLLTPLSLLQIPLQYLTENFHTLPADEIMQTLEAMQRNVKKMNFLVSQLIEFRKLDLNRAQLKLVRTDVVPFVKDIVQSFEELALLKHIDLCFQSDLKHLHVVCDAEKIEIVIYNILSNALKYTPNGGSVTVKTFENQDKTQAVISVEDTGIGISKENLKPIFERFWIGENQAGMMTKGAGVGLSLANDFVKLHDSAFTVTSEEGKGSTFTFYLWLNENHLTNESVTNEIRTEASYSKTNAIIDLVDYSSGEGNPKKNLPLILMLDPDVEVTGYLKYTLKEELNLFSCTNRKEFLSLLEINMPTLIILSDTDFNTSLNLCKEIKSTENRGHIPIIIASSSSDIDAENLAYDNRADAFWIKPYDLSYFKLRINSILKNQSKLKEKIKQELIVNPKEVDITSSDDLFLANVMKELENYISDENYSISDLSEALNITRSMLYRRINRLLGVAPVEFIREVRLKRAAQLLETNSYTVSEIAFKVGFQDTRYFGTCFKKQFGMTPKAYMTTKSRKK